MGMRSLRTQDKTARIAAPEDLFQAPWRPSAIGAGRNASVLLPLLRKDVLLLVKFFLLRLGWFDEQEAKILFDPRPRQ